MKADSLDHYQRLLATEVLRCCMDHPRSFEALVAYLKAFPVVRCEHFIVGESFVGAFRFEDRGHLYFLRSDGQQVHTPAGAPCGPGGFLPQLDFHERGFSVTMFNSTVRYFYSRPEDN